MEKILVLNSGSTTVKFQLFEMEQGFHRVLAKGMVDRIGLPGSKIVVRADNGYEFSCECPVTDHKDAIKAILDYLSHRFLKMPPNCRPWGIVWDMAANISTVR